MQNHAPPGLVPGERMTDSYSGPGPYPRAQVEKESRDRSFFFHSGLRFVSSATSSFSVIGSPGASPEVANYTVNFVVHGFDSLP